jgi:DNA-directed RNA polymerase subunit RPC12/RpoP
MAGFTHEMLVRGMAAAKTGDISEARFYLERLVNRDDSSIDDKCDAWYWLSEISKDPKEQRRYLEDILANNLGDARARRKLAILNGELNPGKIIDPDKIKQTSAPGNHPVTGQRFTCPHCGGRMTFTPDGQSLICESCESDERMKHKTIGEPSREEESFIAALATSKGHFKPLSTRFFTCQSCSANFILPPSQMTLTCPYCTSSYILEQAEKEDTIEPNSLIPFKLTLVIAEQALRTWFKENSLGEEAQLNGISGLYLPAWTFEVGGVISWTCLIQKSAQEESGFNRRQKEWKSDNGQKAIYYDDLLVLASKSLPLEAVQSKVFNFDLRGLETYDPRYLVDRVAENYQIPLAEASLLVRKMTLEKERGVIAGNYFQPMRDLALNTANMMVDAYRLVFLPVWLAHFRVDQKDYRALVNDQNGSIWAEKPQNGFNKWLDGLLEA